MKKALVFLSYLLFSYQAFALGAPYTRSGTTAITDMTGSVNQVTVPTNSEGKQDKQWEQEEESLDATIYEKDKLQKQEEQRQEEQIRLKDSAIEEYRFDVPSSKTYRE